MHVYIHVYWHLNELHVHVLCTFLSLTHTRMYSRLSTDYLPQHRAYRFDCFEHAHGVSFDLAVRLAERGKGL